MISAKNALWLLALLLLTNSGAAQTRSLTIQDVINSVNVDSLTYTVKVLSGEVGSQSGGTSDTIHGRGPYDSGHDVARDWLKGKLDSYGLTTELQAFNRWKPGLNVLGTQTGVTVPAKKFLLCAHYDATTGQPENTPGADDNASGCAAVLEAARILSRYETAYTVVYAFWDQEETGAFGSEKYAQDAAARGDSLLCVINLDMIGWDGNNDSMMAIHTKDVAQSVQLADTVILLMDQYGLGLKHKVYNPGGYESDHKEFWMVGYTAVWLCEAMLPGDYYPYTHTVDDRIRYFNLPFFHRVAKLAIASTAFVVDVRGSVSVPLVNPHLQDFSLEQNYPNPFNPLTLIKYTLGGVRNAGRGAENGVWGVRDGVVCLVVYDLLGREVATLVNERKAPGNYTATFDATGLASGVYFCRLTAGSFVQTKAMVFVR